MRGTCGGCGVGGRGGGHAFISVVERSVNLVPGEREEVELLRRLKGESEIYKYFMSVSRISEPPSLWKIRCSIGVISEALMDWRTSVTVWRCISYLRKELASVLSRREGRDDGKGDGG
jgi:hypothetical protein